MAKCHAKYTFRIINTEKMGALNTSVNFVCYKGWFMIRFDLLLEALWSLKIAKLDFSDTAINQD